MEEIQVIGSKRRLSKLIALQFPEKNFINDLLFHYEKMCDAVSSEEFETLREQVSSD